MQEKMRFSLSTYFLAIIGGKLIFSDITIEEIFQFEFNQLQTFWECD
jgi:hypothetical protein